MLSSWKNLYFAREPMKRYAYPFIAMLSPNLKMTVVTMFAPTFCSFCSDWQRTAEPCLLEIPLFDIDVHVPQATPARLRHRGLQEPIEKYILRKD